MRYRLDFFMGLNHAKKVYGEKPIAIKSSRRLKWALILTRTQHTAEAGLLLQAVYDFDSLPILGP